MRKPPGTLKSKLLPLLVCCTVLVTSAFTLRQVYADTTSVKCMVQLTNYTGEGAYIAVTVIDADNEYVKTVRMLGDDPEWYADLEKWWKWHRSILMPDIDGITGATVAGGERSVFVLEIDNSLLDSGNKLRFETAVEDQRYVPDDLLLDLTSVNLNGKFEGTGYIRYVRLAGGVQ